MYIFFVITVYDVFCHFSLFKGPVCVDSSDCRGNVRKFCNFNNGDSGFCDICRTDIYNSCEDINFPTHQGLNECNRVCRGNMI